MAKRINDLPTRVLTGVEQYEIDVAGITPGKVTTDELKAYMNTYDNTVTVAFSGGDFTSIKDAVDFVITQSPTSSNRWGILVYPGIYMENPITLIPYIDIQPFTKRFTTKIIALNTATPLFTLTGIGPMSIQDFTIEGVTASSAFFNNTATSILEVNDCQIINCQYGFHCSAGVIFANNIETTPTSVMDRMFYVQGGQIQVKRASVKSTGTFNEYAYADGGVLGMEGIIATAPNISKLFEITNGALFFLHNSYANYCNTIFEAGINTESSISSLTIGTLTTNDIVVNDPSAIIHANSCEIDSDKIIYPTNYNNDIITFIDNKVNDEGFKVFGELGVGRPERGSESTLGEGDSYTRGMLVYTYDNTIYTDVSADASDPIGNTFTFPGTGINNAIYISSDLIDTDYLVFYGIKATIATATILGGGLIVAEYWNGISWTEFNHSNIQSNGQYLPFAKQIFERTGSEQIRFNNNILNDWTKNDDPGLGTNRYWVRFRIQTAITVAPIFNQFKLHTSRTEINADGWLESFGKARPTARLSWDFGLMQPATQSPANQDIYYSDNIAVGLIENSFQDGTTDQQGFNIFLPYDLDTSCPIKFRVAHIGSANNNNVVRFVVRWGYSSSGDSVFRTTSQAPTVGPNEQSITKDIVMPGTNILQIEEFELDVSDMISRRVGSFGDLLWVGFERQGNDVADTYNGNFVLVQIDATYVKWCNGGHI